jgi:AcrR family transcriptional regulator
MSPESTKQHILLSTIDAIEKHGLANLTTRLIAEEAGVNNAALHYYFGTKENLIDIVLDQTAEHMLDDTQNILHAETSIETRLSGVLNYLIDGVINYPNLIRAQLTGPIFYSVRKKDLTSLLSTWVNLVRDAIEPHEENINLEVLNIKLNMIISVILMSGLFNRPPGRESWLNLEDPKGRETFLRQAVDMLINL